ncbi:MAG: PLP-dependent aminotransferase family protein [Alicyclobacillus sp.]|nr:PLP-dependent aminotransferase family protein [Alicyclobacillus sp.]
MPALPPGCVRLSAGYPAPDTVPVSELVDAAHRLMRREGDGPYQYLGSERAAQLPELLANRMRVRGIPAAPDQVLVTAGACQAIDLIAQVLLDDDTPVAVEAPTYMEALEVFRQYTDHILAYPVDGDGLMVEALADDLAQRRRRGLPLPRLLYTIPSSQNPTGTTMSPLRRRMLLELAEMYDFLIVEDDAYGELSFGSLIPPLASLDGWTPEPRRVVYVGSLSKVVAPGVRVGWIAGPRPLVEAAGWFKKDLGHPFAEAVVAEYLSAIDLDLRVRDLQRVYRQRAAWMELALRQHLPEGVSWFAPRGGYFIWVHTPGIHTAKRLPDALRAGVAYVPGRYFFQESGRPSDVPWLPGDEWLRLSFSYLSREEMDLGVRRLGDVLKKNR